MCFAGAAWADTGGLRIAINDASGQPLAGATVKVSSPDSLVSRSGVTVYFFVDRYCSSEAMSLFVPLPETKVSVTCPSTFSRRVVTVEALEVVAAKAFRCV